MHFWKLNEIISTKCVYKNIGNSIIINPLKKDPKCVYQNNGNSIIIDPLKKLTQI